MSKAIFAEDVSLKVGGRTVLADINLCIERGEICAVCGGEESGKEYLKNMLLRQYEDKYKLTGKFTVDGMETELLSENDMRYTRMLGIGILPQKTDVAISKYMTGKSYITMPFGEKIQTGKKEILIDAKRLLDIMQIKNPDALLRKRTADMNKRELRAVYYAAALASSPAVLISYGPEEDMDEFETDRLFNLVIKICKIKNIAMLVLTDSVGFAKKYCEQLYFMNQGKLTKAEEGQGEFDLFCKAEQKVVTEKGEVGDNIILQATGALLQKKGGQVIDMMLYGGEISGVCSTNIKEGVKIFCGVKKPYAGEISFDGQDISKMQKYGRNIFVLNGETAASFPQDKTVKEVVSAFAGKGKKAERSLAVYNAITLSGMGGGKADIKVRSLSPLSGIKLGIACAIASSARVIIVSGMEKFKNVSRYEIFKSISLICREGKTSVVILSDDKALLDGVCHKVYGFAAEREEIPAEAE